MYLHLMLNNKYLKVESVLLIFVDPMLMYHCSQVLQDIHKKLSNTYFEKHNIFILQII